MKGKPEIMETLAAFARDKIWTRPELGNVKDFPQDIWAAMGGQGLLDPDGFCGEVAGQDGACRCQTLTRAARILARDGGNLGLTLSWLIHHLTAFYLLGPAGPEAQPGWKTLAQLLKTGEATLSLAVSEPRGGGHPKYISTRAEKTTRGWILNGEKTYLTNGPIARAFVVIAVTGEASGRKAFSAFLVDRETPGLAVQPPLALSFFNPSPHGGIRLQDCRVDSHCLVGEEGQAYSGLVLRFRQLEDALMTGAVTGAMESLAALTAESLDRERRAHCLEFLGRLKATADAAGVLSDQVARAADLGDTGQEGIYLYFRDLAARFVQAVQTVAAKEGLVLKAPGPDLLRDLSASANLGKTVAALRLARLGQTLVKDPA